MTAFAMIGTLKGGSTEPDLRGRMTVVSSAYNAESGCVEEVEVLHRYVEFDMMTPKELSDVHEFLYGSALVGCFDEHRARLKSWTKSNGFDFETRTLGGIS